MKNMIFRGVATALVTPFSGGEIDFSALGRLIERQIEAGVDGLVIGGTTAEAATLSDEERYRLFNYAAECVCGRVKLIFGTGTNDTRVAIRHSKYAARVGCDGLLLVTPYYNKGTELGIEQHYISVANSTDLPIILYNVPSRTGVNLSIRLVERLCEHPKIVAIKEASDSADRLTHLAAMGERLTLYAGNDSQIFTTLALGGGGVISVVSNLVPSVCRDLCRSFDMGDIKRAREIQLSLLPLISAMFLETNPSPVKYALSLMGLCSPDLRLPLSEPTDGTKEQIKGLISSLDLA